MGSNCMMERLNSIEVTSNAVITEQFSEEKVNCDEADLVHFGKRQQFKVSYQLQTLSSEQEALTKFPRGISA